MRTAWREVAVESVRLDKSALRCRLEPNNPRVTRDGEHSEYEREEQRPNGCRAVVVHLHVKLKGRNASFRRASVLFSVPLEL